MEENDDVAGMRQAHFENQWDRNIWSTLCHQLPANEEVINELRKHFETASDSLRYSINNVDDKTTKAMLRSMEFIMESLKEQCEKALDAIGVLRKEVFK